MKRILCFATVLSLTGCGPLVQVCTDIAIPGIAVTVVDSVTAEPPETERLVTATDDGYSDTVRIAGNASMAASLAYERSGTYRVEVKADGYEGWVRSEVHVRETEDECHVEPVSLLARLQVASP